MGICPCVKSQDRDIEEDPERALVQKNRTVEIKEPDPGTSSFSNQIKQRAQVKVEDVYEILNPPIGSGQLGEVRKARHKQTNEMFAIRVIKKISQKEKDKLFLELQLIKNLDHPNICKVIEYYNQGFYYILSLSIPCAIVCILQQQCAALSKFFYKFKTFVTFSYNLHSNYGVLYIVNELLNGDKLFVKVVQQEKGFTEKDAAHYVHQILSAIAFCHSKNVVHRDITADNLIFRTNEDNSILKLIDFGACRYYEPGEIMQQKGISISNVHYKSPQVLNGVYDQSCDVWSCGVLLYIMLYGMPPFYDNSNDRGKIIKKIQSKELEFMDDVEISESAKDLLKLMLEKNPQERITAQDALKHEWIKKRDQHEIDGHDLSKSISHLKTFRANQGIQQAIWGVIVSQLASSEEKERLGKLFISLDKDNSGTLSKDELMSGFLKEMSKQQADELVKQIFSTVDPNQNGEIDYTEFLTATLNRQNALSIEKLEVAFKMFDTDASGKISVDEMLSFFQVNQQSENNQKWIKLIEEADENRDGEIDFDEFKKLMLKMLEGFEAQN